LAPHGKAGDERTRMSLPIYERPMANARCHAVFPTAIGECAIAWNGEGLVAVWLSSSDAGAMPRRLRSRWPEAAPAAPSGDVAAVVAAIAGLLSGEHVGFATARLDLGDTGDFDRCVYAVTRGIAAGQLLTYGEVAARVGAGASARAVGQSLGRNPSPIVVPCHRVVAAGHALGGFSAPSGTATKRRLLAIERAHRAGAPDLSIPCRATARANGSRQTAAPMPGTDAALCASAGVLIDPSDRS
jgi:methylated-DNA-[protein]-cysteine S-methyltransferase